MKNITFVFLFFCGITAFSQTKTSALVRHESPFSFEETCVKLEKAFSDFELKTFACIDHAQNAEQVGLSLSPSRVYLVGNPKAGTSLMAEIPEMAIHLPLKFLVFEKDGKVTILYQNITPLLTATRTFTKTSETMATKIDSRMQLLLYNYFGNNESFGNKDEETTKKNK